MRVGIVRWQVKKSLQPRQSGSFLHSSGVKTRSVARLTQEMIWQKFLILLKRHHLQCADGKQVHNFHQDPSPVKMHYSEVMWNAIVARIVSSLEYCRGHHREEETSKLCSGCRKVFHSGLHQPPADCERTRLAVS